MNNRHANRNVTPASYVDNNPRCKVHQCMGINKRASQCKLCLKDFNPRYPNNMCHIHKRNPPDVRFARSIDNIVLPYNENLLRNNNVWFDDQSILYCMKLIKDKTCSFLKRHNPSFGLVNSRKERTGNIINEIFIDIVNIDDLHWVCCSNLMCTNPNSELIVYDSFPYDLYEENPRFYKPTDYFSSIYINCPVYEHILRSRGPGPKKITVLKDYSIDTQTNNNDCGAYSLIFCSMLSKNKNPADFKKYINPREHVIDCMIKQNFSLCRYRYNNIV